MEIEVEIKNEKKNKQKSLNKNTKVQRLARLAAKSEIEWDRYHFELKPCPKRG